MSIHDGDFSTAQLRAVKAIERSMGPVLLNALEDQQTLEIMLRSNGSVWLDSIGSKMQKIAVMSNDNARDIILNVAGFHGREVKPSSPSLECVFPIDGSRFAALVPPSSTEHVFTIRKATSALLTFDEYISSGVMTPHQAESIRESIRTRKNILVIGGTGSGKTTLTNSIISEIISIYPDTCFYIIEDTQELRCHTEKKVMTLATPHTSMNDLLRFALRHRPDRILIGEVRGKEAYSLLKAWNTGHPGGVGTIHADSAEDSLLRLANLIAEEDVRLFPIAPSLISNTVNTLIYIEKTGSANPYTRIKQLIHLQGYENGKYIFESI